MLVVLAFVLDIVLVIVFSSCVVRVIVLAAAVAAAALRGSGKQDKRLGRMELIAQGVDGFVFGYKGCLQSLDGSPLSRGSVKGHIGPWRFCLRA